MLDIIVYVLFGLFLLILPGFLFSLVLYPKPDGIDFWTRVGMSLALGVMLLLYVGFFLAKPELKMLETLPFIGATFLLCAVLSVMAYLRGGGKTVRVYIQAVLNYMRKLLKREKVQPPSSQSESEQQIESTREEAPKRGENQ